jgi:hypothetical protein
VQEIVALRGDIDHERAAHLVTQNRLKDLEAEKASSPTVPSLDATIATSPGSPATDLAEKMQKLADLIAGMNPVIKNLADESPSIEPHDSTSEDALPAPGVSPVRYPDAPTKPEPVTDDEKRACLLCNERERATVIVGCGCVYSCVTCMSATKPKKCLGCKKPVDRVLCLNIV